MDIDLSVLRSLESEKDISLDLAIKAIEDALLVAYHKSEGASPSCLLYTSPSPRDRTRSRMPSSA